MKITEDNYFDVAEALHVFLSTHHEGQFSKKYELLCRSEFNPGIMFSEEEFLAEPTLEYDEISLMDDEQLTQMMDTLDEFLASR